MVDIIKNLEQCSKKELLDIVCELVENGNLELKSLEEFFKESCLTKNEETILNKLNNNTQLTEEEKNYITETLETCTNRKIGNILKGKNEFYKALVYFKIGKYFNPTWSRYPRKVGKELGKKAYLKLVEDKKLKDLNEICKYIYKRVDNYAKECEEKGTDEQYILHFSTFCNSRKYL